ncbi:hypothetical protein JKF63_02060 [Porcisia hertigi]|uniref:Uncharacterized protein n=1 Tax=Porcisia hertigi TaxID=2761500 RepID=A0A836LCB6_9TRYP|nr:hypothetical protein JKF63_02060 [Porcisia hertigi]
MDAAALFHERRADVAAFSALVFRPPTEVICKPRNPSAPVSLAQPETVNRQDASAFLLTRGATGTPSYRRPASANVPVSRVLQEVKARAAKELQIAHRARKTTQGNAYNLSGDPPYLPPAGSRSGASLQAMGFSTQEIRDRTYLWMSETGLKLTSADDISRRAINESTTLTTHQQAKLRRLRIKRTHQRLLSEAQWALWLRRRRRLWYRRRPVARRRHFTRQLALQYGRPVGICQCCRRKKHTPRTSTSARKTHSIPIKAMHQMVTQWLPSHSRLVKRFHYRVVSLAVQPAVTHVSLAPGAGSTPLRRGGGVPLCSATPCESRRAKHLRLCASPVALIAIPCEPARKDHRFLQRWATALAVHQRRQLFCSPTIRNGQSDHLHRSPSASVSTPTMLADLSHQCVYELIPRREWPVARTVSTAPNSPGDPTSVASSVIAAFLEALGLRPNVEDVRTVPSGVAFRLSPMVRHTRTRRTPAIVVHGHMWGAGAAFLGDAALETADLRCVSLSTLSRHTRVVPVVLVASLGSSASDAPVDVFLFSPCPVHFTRRATGEFQIRLVSLWNPCSLISTYASVFEYWRYNSCVHSSEAEAEMLSTVKRAFQRCARVYRRLQLRPPRSSGSLRVRGRKLSKTLSQKGAPGGSAETARAITAVPRVRHRDPSLTRRLTRLSLIAYPSLPSPFLLDSHSRRSEEGSSAPYAWCLALLYRSSSRRRRASCTEMSNSPAAKAPSQVAPPVVPIPSVRRTRLLSRQARRAFFQLARRFFGFLVMAPPPNAAACGGASTRGQCRVLGFQDRVTLLHLIGRPAYPLDYGLSRPSEASRQRQRQRSRPTPNKTRVSKQGARRGRTPTDEICATTAPTSAPLPSSLHVLEYYGNLTNAACRVFVRAADTDRKLPTLHSSVGTILLRCHWRKRREDSVSRTPCVVRIGVVSSSAFFAQRFGCKVAPVWCCFPPTTGAAHGSSASNTLGSIDENALAAPATHWTAVSLASDTTFHRGLAYLLAPPEVADDLLRRSTLLQRDEPSRKRIHSRRQRAFDLEERRAVRELHTLLYDPLSCSPVHLIQWYA